MVQYLLESRLGVSTSAVMLRVSGQDERRRVRSESAASSARVFLLACFRYLVSMGGASDETPVHEGLNASVCICASNLNPSITPRRSAPSQLTGAQLPLMHTYITMFDSCWSLERRPVACRLFVIRVERSSASESGRFVLSCGFGRGQATRSKRAARR